MLKDGVLFFTDLFLLFLYCDRDTVGGIPKVELVHC